ncbi:hypothetical protein K9N68_39825 (plasmid) [Kovacikia minuta CCNUW1]|uniref:hypothetical protein n=1 Tax=Kovacikia minuta TaxID=2931930 RepID=UPI001CCECEAF|nr:hypothetical protein [Kovacikia minuta]UBF30748.1 hypothetical protein K9N68_39825 [Kovacikia minuta CCNUW1]
MVLNCQERCHTPATAAVLTPNDLLYSGGLQGYLDAFQGEALAPAEGVTDPTVLTQIWQQVLSTSSPSAWLGTLPINGTLLALTAQEGVIEAKLSRSAIRLKTLQDKGSRTDLLYY